MFASVLKENEVIHRRVRVSLNPNAGEGVVPGFIYLPPGANLEVGEYTLKLGDGRTITAAVMGVRGGIAIFRGSNE